MLLLAQSSAEVTGSGATTEGILFWIFATVAVGAGIGVVSLRNIVHSALLLVVNLLSIAGLYLGLQSSFLSIAQVIVYAGAIMVLFLFVIMLLGVDRDDLLTETSIVRTGGAVLAGVVLAAGLLFVLGADSLTSASACGGLATPGDGTEMTCVGLEDALADEPQGSVGFLADSLFREYGFAFEASALLLVVATLGALVLGRRRDPDVDDELHASGPTPTPDDVEALVAAQVQLARDEGLQPDGTVAVTELDGDDLADDSALLDGSDDPDDASDDGEDD